MHNTHIQFKMVPLKKKTFRNSDKIIYVIQWMCAFEIQNRQNHFKMGAFPLQITFYCEFMLIYVYIYKKYPNLIYNTFHWMLCCIVSSPVRLAMPLLHIKGFRKCEAMGDTVHCTCVAYLPSFRAPNEQKLIIDFSFYVVCVNLPRIFKWLNTQRTNCRWFINDGKLEFRIVWI